MTHELDGSLRTLRDHLARVEVGMFATWFLGFGVVAWLGLNGGGFDPLEYQRFGLYIWLVILAGICLLAIPTRRLGAAAWTSVTLLAFFAVWTGLGFAWTDSPDKTGAELARVASYLGVFVLALFSRANGTARHLTSGVATAIVLVASVALLSKLHPTWFPEASTTGELLPSEARRLAYPIGYWNGLGALIAIGIPLLLNLAATAKSDLARIVSAAGIPVLVLALYFTLSRGSFLAVGIATVTYFLLVPSRMPKFLTLLIGVAAGAVLVAASRQKEALSDGLLNSTARDQGNEILYLTLAVVGFVALTQAIVVYSAKGHELPRWLVVDKRQTLVTVGVTLFAVVIAAFALGAADKAGDSWGDFKSAEGLQDSAGRLESASGNGRYQYWSAALKQFESRPLTGTGAGTFESWWATTGDRPGFVRDAHSLYFQTLGEMGIVGIALLLSFFVLVLSSGLRMLFRTDAAARPPLAAACAGVLAFLVMGAFDWIWQIPVLPATLVLLASVLIPVKEPVTGSGSTYGWLSRLGMAAAAVVAIVVISIPLSSTALIDKSQEEARSGNYLDALSSARGAGKAFPAAAAPNLQQALVLEQLGDLRSAEAEALRAVKDEPVNWRNWLVLSRIQASLGKVGDSVESYREASRLNHLSPIFSR